MQYCEQIWQDHNNRFTEHLTAATIQQLQEQFKDCIFHNEDKRASSLRIFCPCQYFQCMEKTFNELPSGTLKITIAHLRNKFDKDYPWALGRGKSLPSGYILAKRKKQYCLGRPNIGFVGPCSVPLQNSYFKSYPGRAQTTLHTETCTSFLKLLRNYATTMEDKALKLFNQDLAGFFISINTTRFLESWQILLRFLAPHMSVDESEYFSVSPVKQNNPGDIIKGRTFRTLNVNRHIGIGDIPSLIVAALQMQNFQLGSRVFTRAQGSPMGSPLSPALCLMVVSVYEQIWHHTHEESITNMHHHALFLRYVDSRLALIPASTVDLPAYQILIDADFYTSPIILETEPDQEFLGFQLELNPFEMIYQCPRDMSSFISNVGISSVSPS